MDISKTYYEKRSRAHPWEQGHCEGLDVTFLVPEEAEHPVSVSSCLTGDLRPWYSAQ